MSGGFVVTRRSKSDGGKRKQTLLGRSVSLLPHQLNASRQSKKDVDEMITRVRENDPRLTTATLRDVRATTNAFNDFLGALEVNTTLTKVDVAGNSLQDLGVCELFNRLMISGNKCIRVINVCNNAISKTSGEKILQYLSFHFHVSHIFYDDSLITLSDAGLTTSKFDKQRISEGMRRQIEDKLRSNRVMLSFLNKETNRFECRDRRIKGLQGVIREHWGDRITSLNVSSNEIREFPSTMGCFNLLEELIVPNNKLESLPDYIGQLLRLRVIDVSHNQISRIRHCLRSLLRLESLVLNDNQISHLPLFLARLPKLELLSATRNPIKRMDEQILLDGESGGGNVLEFLRDRLERLVIEGVGEEKVSADDLELVQSLQKERLENPEAFCLQLPEPQNQVEVKMVCEALTPRISNETPTAIRRIDDIIWCGTDKGTVYKWDCRSMRFQEKLENALPGSILEIIEATKTKEVWLGGNCNVISVFSRDKDKEWAPPLHINFGRGYSAVQSMIYLKETNRVWVGTSDVILSICADEHTIQGTVTMDSPVMSLVYHNSFVWAGCGDGKIYIMKSNGRVKHQLVASRNGMVFKVCVVGSYIWSTANENHVKVWMQVSDSKVHCIAKIAVHDAGLHFMVASSHGETMYIVNGTSSEVLEFSPTGKLLTRFTSHHQSYITSMTWSLSPDRLWTTDAEGTVCYFELKMGKKTRERLLARSLSQLPEDALSSAEQEPPLQFPIGSPPREHKMEQPASPEQSLSPEQSPSPARGWVNRSPHGERQGSRRVLLRSHTVDAIQMNVDDLELDD